MHTSEQVEAALKRRVRCEVPLIAMGILAEKLESVGTVERLSLEGFLASRGFRRQRELVFHLQSFDLIK